MDDKIENQIKEVDSIKKPSVYFSVSLFKFTIMYFGTFGLYGFYWFYKNWVHIKNELGLDINPAWRTIFAPLWAYSLFDFIQDKANKGKLDLSIYPGPLAVVYFLFVISARLPDYYGLLSFFSFLPLIVANNATTKINEKLCEDFQQNKSIRGWNWLVIVLPGLIFILTIVGGFLSYVNFPSVSEHKAITPDMDNTFLKARSLKEGDVSIIDTQEKLDLFSNDYYKHKNTVLVSSTMSFIDKGSDIPIKIISGAVSGFYSQVFRENPDKLGKWIKEINEFTERGQGLFLNALWISNVPEAKRYLEQRADAATGHIKAGLRELVESAPPNLNSVVPNNHIEGDMVWGAFLATGDPIYIVNIIEATAQYDNREDFNVFINAAIGKWSLAANAQQHEIVYRTLEEQLNKYDGKKKKIIQDIFQKAEMPSGPNIIMEEIDQVIAEQKRNGKWLLFKWH